MEVKESVQMILGEQLQIQDQARTFDLDTPLLGAIPEFDSMAVVNIIVALEEEFGIMVDDDELGADVFETFGTLVNFVEAKVA